MLPLNAVRSSNFAVIRFESCVGSKHIDVYRQIHDNRLFTVNLGQGLFRFNLGLSATTG
jgi:hypothetical protein